MKLHGTGGRRHAARMLLASGLLLLGGCRPAPPAMPPPQPPEVSVVRPEMRPVKRTIETTGVIRAENSVQLRARVRGFVATKHKQGGDRVKAGERVITIDQRPFEAAAASAKAEVAQRRAQQDLAVLTLQRMTEAAKASAVSAYEVDKAKAERDAAQAAVDLALARQRQAELDLEFTEVRSPINGRLGVEVIDEGQLVGASEATLLATVVDDSAVYATYQLDERQVLELRRENENRRPGEDGRPGMVVEMGLMNEAGYPHTGQYSRSDSGVDSSTGTITIEARFENPGGTILPGAFVRIRAILGDDQGLMVPDVSVLADQRGRFVYVVTKGNQGQEVARRVDVTVGPVEDGLRRILPGADGRMPLTVNDRVVSTGVQRARPESPVRVTPDAPAPSAQGKGS